MKCPCEECLMIPICRHKSLNILLECEPMKEYLMNYTCSLVPTKRRTTLRQGVIDILKPSQWNIDKDGYFTGSGIQKKERGV